METRLGARCRAHNYNGLQPSSFVDDRLSGHCSDTVEAAGGVFPAMIGVANFGSTAPAHRPMTNVAMMLLVRLVAARLSAMKRSTVSSSASQPTGSTSTNDIL